MPRIFILLFSAFLFNSVASAKEKGPTIGLIGDSTVATTYGWGPAFSARVKDGVTVLNFAKNGATLDSLSKRFDELLSKKPDFVLIQFGHNDMKKYDAETYEAKLKTYVEKAKLAGSKVIVLSSVTRRNFDCQGKISPSIIESDRSLPAFSKAARKVANEAVVAFIDLNAISIEHHNRIGPEESATYNFEKTDTTHFSKKGAKAIADLIITELRVAVPELATSFQ